jgi:hypothetical protein
VRVTVEFECLDIKMTYVISSYILLNKNQEATRDLLIVCSIFSNNFRMLFMGFMPRTKAVLRNSFPLHSWVFKSKTCLAFRNSKKILNLFFHAKIDPFSCQVIK